MIKFVLDIGVKYFPLTQISEIKIADIPDVDLSNVGGTKYGSFSVEVIDPVSDYLELLEVSHLFASLESSRIIHVNWR